MRAVSGYALDHSANGAGLPRVGVVFCKASRVGVMFEQSVAML